MDRLLREGDPPTGQIASPKPQYKKQGETTYEPVEGQHGAPFAALIDTEGTPITPASTADITELKSELALVKQELTLIKVNQLSGDQKIQLSGSIPQLKEELVADATPVSIPASSYSAFLVTGPNGYKYRHIECGLSSPDSFSNSIELSFRSTTDGATHNMGPATVLAVGTRTGGAGVAASIGRGVAITWRNLDSASAHNVYRYAAGIRM